MKFEYFPDSDTLYIALRDEPGSDAREVAPDLVVDFNAQGDVVGIEIEHASRQTDLGTLEVLALPVRNAV